MRNRIRNILIEYKSLSSVELIDNLLFAYVTSNLKNFEQRNSIIKELSEIDIDSMYKTVPSHVLYRYGKPFSEYFSTSYKKSGAIWIRKWYREMYPEETHNDEIMEIDTNDIDVLICILSFYKYSKARRGYMKFFSRMISKESEVVCKYKDS